MAGDDKQSNPLWDPFGLWRSFGRAAEEGWEAATSAAASPFTGTPLPWLMEAIRSRLVGRRIRWAIGDTTVAFRLEDVAATADTALLAAGQADLVTLSATEVTWGSAVLERVHASLHNVHTRLGLRPQIVAAPVDLLLSLSAEEVTRRIRNRVAWVRADITDGAVVRVYHDRHPDWGWIDVTLSARDGGILARFVRGSIGSRPLRLTPRLPGLPIRLSFPPNARLAEVSVRDGHLDLLVRLDERRIGVQAAVSWLSRRDRSASADESS